MLAESAVLGAVVLGASRAVIGGTAACEAAWENRSGQAGLGGGRILAGAVPSTAAVSSLLGEKMVCVGLSLLAVFARAQEEAAETPGLRPAGRSL